MTIEFAQDKGSRIQFIKDGILQSTILQEVHLQSALLGIFVPTYTRDNPNPSGIRFIPWGDFKNDDLSALWRGLQLWCEPITYSEDISYTEPSSSEVIQLVANTPILGLKKDYYLTVGLKESGEEWHDRRKPANANTLAFTVRGGLVKHSFPRNI